MNIRKLFWLMVIGALAGCSEFDFDHNDFKDDANVTSLNGTWQVISFEDFNSKTVEFPSQENNWGRDIIITFNDENDPAEYSGTNTTNSIFGEFDYKGNRQFEVRRMGTTFVNEPPWGSKFGQALLDSDSRFKINNSRLRIYYDSQSKSVTLSRK